MNRVLFTPAWQDILLATRPKTLVASVIPVLVGSALSFAHTRVLSPLIFTSTLLSSGFIQIACNFYNDAYDGAYGTDVTRLGETRLVGSGRLGFKQMLNWGHIASVLSLLAGSILVAKGGWPILLLGLLSLLCAWGYTATKASISYNGLAELFCFWFFGIFAVTGTYYCQTLSVDLLCLVAGSQMGLLATLLLAINNARDIEQDAACQKKTLAVRLGLRSYRFLIGIMLLTLFLLLAVYAHLGVGPLVVLPSILIAKAIRIWFTISREPPSAKYNQTLAEAAKLFVFFGLLLSFGLLGSISQ
jgi:1,4-dihydroxy-2-naphthoate octaprenyltransferase